MKILLLILLFIGAQKTYASEDDLYDFLWLDPDKKVYVLQNKVYKRKGRKYADIGFIKNLSSDFQTTYGTHLKFGYYLSEDWALEGIYNKYTNSDNAALKNLKQINNTVPFIRKFNDLYGVAANWSPFYGKINTFNKIFYFDWSFGAGVVKINAQSNVDTASDPDLDGFKKETFTGGLLKTGLRFHINKNIHLGLDYQNTIYKAKTPGNPAGLKQNSDAILSIGFSF